MIQLIGLSGKSGVGKDHVARLLEPLGYKPFSLAWHLKVHIVGTNEATYNEVFKIKPPRVRTLMQQVGTERGRDVYGDDVWLNHMWTWMRLFGEHWGISKFVIPDVRFPNEARFVQDQGGLVFNIMAPERNAQNQLTQEQRQHLSETAMDAYASYDDILYNDFGQEDTIYTQLISAIARNKER